MYQLIFTKILLDKKRFSLGQYPYWGDIMAYRPKDAQERITHRLKISLGHLKKIIQMVEEDNYCIDILHQSQAIQEALKKTDELILENHLKNCVSDAIRKGEDRKVIAEIMSVIKKGR